MNCTLKRFWRRAKLLKSIVDCGVITSVLLKASIHFWTQSLDLLVFSSLHAWQQGTRKKTHFVTVILSFENQILHWQQSNPVRVKGRRGPGKCTVINLPTFLAINTFRITSLTACQLLQPGNCMPEKQQQPPPPLWQGKKNHRHVYFNTRKGSDGEGAIRKLPWDDSSYCIWRNVAGGIVN